MQLYIIDTPFCLHANSQIHPPVYIFERKHIGTRRKIAHFYFVQVRQTARDFGFNQ